MAIQVKLATSGIAGVTRLAAGAVTGTTPVSANSVNLLQDGGAFISSTVSQYTITLPIESVGLLGGTIIDFKNLLTEDPVTPGVTNLVTIDSNGAFFDGLPHNSGTTSSITTNTRNEAFKLVYVNQTIGWTVL